MSGATSGNMTWAQLREAFLKIAGDSSGAKNECYAHLTAGYRELVRRIDLPETFKESADITVAANTDFFVVLTELTDRYELHAIDSVYNVTDGRPIEPEPSGYAGRDRFLLESTNKPPTGQVRFYVRYGPNVYLRDTPNASTKIRVRYHMHAPTISGADLNNNPETPPHLDWAIVHLAAMSYFEGNPEQDRPVGENQPPPSQKHLASAQRIISPPDEVHVKLEENQNTTHKQRVAGYRFSPRSRVWR